MPDSQSLEAVLIQSELQNKVRALLDHPLPIPDDLPNNENLTINFEKGKLYFITVYVFRQPSHLDQKVIYEYHD